MRSRLAVCCGNCDWYKPLFDEMVCTNPDGTDTLNKKQREEWCNAGFKERLEDEQKR